MHPMSAPLAGLLLAAAVIAAPTDDTELLFARQGPEAGLAMDCPYKTDGGPVGQPLLHTQVTENTLCSSEGGCQTTSEKGFSFGIEAGVDVSLVKEALGDVGASFGVTEEWTESESHTCPGGPGDTVCVWYTTAYSLFNMKVDGDGCSNPTTTQAKIPHADNAGGGYYCVNGARYCRSIQSHYWDN